MQLQVLKFLFSSFLMHAQLLNKQAAFHKRASSQTMLEVFVMVLTLDYSKLRTVCCANLARIVDLVKWVCPGLV